MVAVPPTIATQPGGHARSIPARPPPLSVTAGASGADDPTVFYQWYAGASPDVSQPVASTSASFTTPVLTASASYWVRLSNAAGFTTDSNAAAIFVNQPPAIVTGPASSRVNPNTSVALSVTAGASGTSDSTINYQWYSGQSGDTSAPVGTNAASYTTPSLTATASYWVRLSNSASLTTDSSTATISVNQFPVISKQPASRLGECRLGRFAPGDPRLERHRCLASDLSVVPGSGRRYLAPGRHRQFGPVAFESHRDRDLLRAHHEFRRPLYR